MASPLLIVLLSRLVEGGLRALLGRRFLDETTGDRAPSALFRWLPDTDRRFGGTSSGASANRFLVPSAIRVPFSQECIHCQDRWG